MVMTAKRREAAKLPSREEQSGSKWIRDRLEETAQGIGDSSAGIELPSQERAEKVFRMQMGLGCPEASDAEIAQEVGISLWSFQKYLMPKLLRRAKTRYTAAVKRYRSSRLDAP
jgi:hypothetical protein